MEVIALADHCYRWTAQMSEKAWKSVVCRIEDKEKKIGEENTLQKCDIEISNERVRSSYYSQLESNGAKGRWSTTTHFWM